jgi:putative hydrolases of HD superfamily
MDQLLRFIALTQEFKTVRRKILLAKENREENDAEHSFQLAVVAMYLIESEKIPLDAHLAIKYALIHDVVEVYAGDTPAALLKGSAEALKTKHAREEAAAARIASEFPEFTELHELIGQYETKANPEARFVNALDKLLPILNVYTDRGYSWRVHEVSLNDLITFKSEQVAKVPEVKKHFDLIIERMRAEESELFG